MRLFLQWVFKEEWERIKNERQKKWEETLAYYDRLNKEAIQVKSEYLELCMSLKADIDQYEKLLSAVKSKGRGPRVN